MEDRTQGRLIIQRELGEISDNLALEHAIMEVFSLSTEKVIIRVWRNKKTVVLGRNQRLEEEIDEDYCMRNDIKINRRISGGGTVYHDEGNWNISFFVKKEVINIQNVEELNIKFTDTIIKSLQNMGLEKVERRGKSNIFYNGKKVSGSAEFHKKFCILHHATLLIEANLEHLEKSLVVKEQNPSLKRMSKYAPTINMTEVKIEEFVTELVRECEKEWGLRIKEEGIKEEEKEEAERLKEKIYERDLWVRERQRTIK